jgi:hypothetical protein
MSEEEIIKNLKELISWKGKNVEIRDYEIDAIKDLLDLYNKEKEKNEVLQKELDKKIKALDIAMSNPDYICKDKIRKDLESCKKVYEQEMKPYMIEIGKNERALNITGLSKKEKDELVNKRNCLLTQMRTYEMLLEG